MQFNVGKQLKDFEGNPILDGKLDTKGNPSKLTLRKVCVNALTAPESGISGEDHCHRYQLAMQIYQTDKAMSVSVEDIALIKRLISNAYPSPLVVGQALEMLDPSAEEKEI
ncbi:MAG: hypothetical protein GY854_02155 [Deltaproteobacteria bacterium]|nr:hypothetical protein [Deltaproteobacteria bacterium]